LARYYNGTSYEHEKKINPDLIVKGKTNTELNRAIELDSEYISYLNEISKLEDLKVYITRILDFVKFQGNHLKTCADQIRFADGAFR
jgi:lipase chaperone LimK